jgi:hypothetical protein
MQPGLVSWHDPILAALASQGMQAALAVAMGQIAAKPLTLFFAGA